MLLMTGCGTLFGVYDTGVRVYFDRTTTVSDVEVWSREGLYHKFGIGVPDTGKTYVGPMEHNPRDQYAMRWKDNKEVVHEFLWDARKTNFSLYHRYIVFSIDEDNEVTVTIEKKP